MAAGISVTTEVAFSHQWCVDSVFLTPHPILFGKFLIRIQPDSVTTMMQVI